MNGDHKSEFIPVMAPAFGAQTIVVIAIIVAIIFSGGSIADFLNKVF